MEEKPTCICLKDCDQCREITRCVCSVCIPAFFTKTGWIRYQGPIPTCVLLAPKQFLNQKGNQGLKVRHNANRSESPSVVIQHSLLHQSALRLSLSVAQAN